MSYIAIQYLTYSWLQTFLFMFVFVVLLRGFLGFYQDLETRWKTGQWHFAWFKLGKKKEKVNDEKVG